MPTHAEDVQAGFDRKLGSSEDRFWSRIAVVDDCWEWLGARYRNGYGQFMDRAKNRLAHRWAYEHFRGPIPAGMQIDHLCRNRGCVKPDHLEIVDDFENQRRGKTLTARNLAKTHCDHGHLLDGISRVAGRRDHRYCKECARIYQRHLRASGYYKKRKAMEGQ